MGLRFSCNNKFFFLKNTDLGCLPCLCLRGLKQDGYLLFLFCCRPREAGAVGRVAKGHCGLLWPPGVVCAIGLGERSLPGEFIWHSGPPPGFFDSDTTHLLNVQAPGYHGRRAQDLLKNASPVRLPGRPSGYRFQRLW